MKQPINFLGHTFPNNDLIKSVIRAHIKAVQEYDHATAILLEKFANEYANRYNKVKR